MSDSDTEIDNFLKELTEENKENTEDEEENKEEEEVKPIKITKKKKPYQAESLKKARKAKAKKRLKKKAKEELKEEWIENYYHIGVLLGVGVLTLGAGYYITHSPPDWMKLPENLTIPKIHQEEMHQEEMHQEEIKEVDQPPPLEKSSDLQEEKFELPIQF